uniref:Uncharacterized protein n=1 Tax=Arundo donax TaxID=35708 RepID=A0A0A8ZWF9_ARUDO
MTFSSSITISALILYLASSGSATRLLLSS